MDVSWLFPALAGAAGAFFGERFRQARIERTLDDALAARWRTLTGWERYAVGRDLRRGRRIDDPELGARVAPLMSAELHSRTPLVLTALMGGLFAALAIVALAHGRVVLALIELAFVAMFVAFLGLRRRTRRKLAAAELVNAEAAGLPPAAG